VKNNKFIPTTLNTIMVLVPIIILIYFIFRYYVDAPFLDQWSLVPLLEKYCRNNLSINDLWAQHNEHRIFFPQLVMLLMAGATGWNIGFEVGINILLAVCLLIVIALQTHKIKDGHWLLPAISILIFSLVQWENWLWGWQLQIFLNVLAVTAGLFLLSNDPPKRRNFIGALLLGIVASYSFANGILYWPIGFAILLAGNYKKYNYVILWGIAGIMSIVLYFYGYHSISSHPSMLVLFRSPIEYLKYFFAYLGGALGKPNAILIGMGGLFIWSICIVFLKLNQKFEKKTLLPFIALGLYPIGSALLTGIGRTGFGYNQALASRYTTISNLFWISILFFLFIIIKSGKTKYQTYISLFVFSIILTLNLQASFHYAGMFKVWKEWFEPAKKELVSLKNQGFLNRLCPYEPNLITERAPILKKYKLSVFRIGR